MTCSKSWAYCKTYIFANSKLLVVFIAECSIYTKCCNIKKSDYCEQKVHINATESYVLNYQIHELLFGEKWTKWILSYMKNFQEDQDKTKQSLGWQKMTWLQVHHKSLTTLESKAMQTAPGNRYRCSYLLKELHMTQKEAQPFCHETELDCKHIQ